MEESAIKIANLESQMADVRERLGKVEEKAGSAWHTIREVREDVVNLSKQMDAMKTNVSQIAAKQDSMEGDLKQIKIEQKGINRSLKVLIGVVAFLSVICLGFFVYIWKHDAELAKSILTLGTTVSKAIGI